LIESACEAGVSPRVAAKNKIRARRAGGSAVARFAGSSCFC